MKSSSLAAFRLPRGTKRNAPFLASDIEQIILSSRRPPRQLRKRIERTFNHFVYRVGGVYKPSNPIGRYHFQTIAVKKDQRGKKHSEVRRTS